jgi:hypothetical protein
VMVRHTTSTGASITTSRSIMRPGISTRSLPERAGRNRRSPVAPTVRLQPTVAHQTETCNQ